MLAVYETVDLGLVRALADADQKSSLLELLQANYPVLYPDPIYDDLVYVYHAFGVHVLDLGEMLNSLVNALRRRADEEEDDTALTEAVARSAGTSVQPIVSTFSVEHK
jgi:nucleoporin NUP82